jgi:FkbM family methyltransferase
MVTKLWLPIKNALRRLGVDVQRYRPSDVRTEPSLTGTLARLRAQGFPPATLIDVGASDGYWAIQYEHAFPGAACLMIEANPVHQAPLQQLCERNPAFQYEMKAAGSESGTLYFDGSDPLGGHLSEKPLSPSYRPCPVTTIDAEVARHQLKPPFAIKLDTHGVEVPILSGARRTLEQTEIVVIECYNFFGVPPQLPFWEMCRWMLERGFRPWGLHDILYRPHDRVLWQMDLVFAKTGRKEFGLTSYRPAPATH